MSGDDGQVLLSTEAEAYVEALECINVDQIGGPKWTKQHEYIEKLNMQAVVSASNNQEEFVKEFLITYEKIPVLVHEVIATEIWKQKIFQEFVNMDFNPKVTFPIYIVLYHEATLVNLLETVLFHRQACESAEDSILDVVDYCYRKITYLVSRQEESGSDVEVGAKTTSNPAGDGSMKELVGQEKTLDFDVSIKTVSILRYVTDCLEDLPLSVMTRLLNTHDIPILLVQLVENPPWSQEKDGKLFKYIDSKWQEIPHVDRFKLTKTEGQVWLSLFQLLMKPDCQQKYELDSYKKNTILKLRSYLTEVMLDQMPVLAEFQRYLEHLSMMEPPPAKKDLILEQVPEIRDKILNAHEGKWKKIAKKQSKTFFNPTQTDLRDQAKRWADTYNFDVLESLISEPPKCAACGSEAVKRCSRCQNEWYCRRECQVNHWKKHKPACDLMFDALQKLKQDGSGTG